MFDIFFYFLIFVFGLIVGSFLNCVIFRLEKNESFLRGRSYCPFCRHSLNFLDLVPLFSFLFLKGRCRYCQKPISWQYFLVEAATGSIFLLIFIFFAPLNMEFSGQTILSLIYYWTIASFLIVIFVYDLKHYIIPDKAIYPAIIIAFIFRFFEVLSFNYWSLSGVFSFGIAAFEPMFSPILSAVFASGFFLAIVLISKGQWMGVGDIKLAFLMGLMLGWPNILIALFLAFFIGALVGVFLILKNKKTFKSEIPFGPFLILGTFIALFFGSQIIDWYAGFFLI